MPAPGVARDPQQRQLRAGASPARRHGGVRWEKGEPSGGKRRLQGGRSAAGSCETGASRPGIGAERKGKDKSHACVGSAPEAGRRRGGVRNRVPPLACLGEGISLVDSPPFIPPCSPERFQPPLSPPAPCCGCVRARAAPLRPGVLPRWRLSNSGWRNEPGWNAAAATREARRAASGESTGLRCQNPGQERDARPHRSRAGLASTRCGARPAPAQRWDTTHLTLPLAPKT